MHIFAQKITLHVADDDLIALAQNGVSGAELEQFALIQYYCDGLETEATMYLERDPESGDCVLIADETSATIRKIEYEIEVTRIAL